MWENNGVWCQSKGEGKGLEENPKALVLVIHSVIGIKGWLPYHENTASPARDWQNLLVSNQPERQVKMLCRTSGGISHKGNSKRVK